MPTYISFDHDLGYNVPTGADLARWIVEQDLDNNSKFIPTEFDFYVYYDNTTNKNKLRLYNTSTKSTEIYNLNSSSLAVKEIKYKNKLSAYPIPTDNILNIANPENGADKIEIYDTNGKMIIIKSFENSEKTISLDVENLAEGIYIYKIGNLSSKFIKSWRVE